MFKKDTVNYIKKLSKNNNKPWFEEHRDEYVKAREDFEKFVSGLIKKVGLFDEDIKELSPKDCIFRLYRDVRFSKDKTPYKTHFGASFDKGGRKSIYAGYYFHIEPGNKSFAGGGIWMPMAPEIKKIRQEIDYNLEEFQKIISDKKFKKEYGQLDDADEVKLKTLPRGYEKDNPATEFIKLKSILALKNIPDEELTKPTLLNNTVKTFEALMPLIKFINHSLQ